MNNKLIPFCSFVSALVLATACSSVPDDPAKVYGTVGQADSVQLGTVNGIQTRETAQRHSAADALLGAVVGGVAGHQIGGGTGKTAATAVGAVGGAVVGDRIASAGHDPQSYYQIDVRMDNGDLRMFDYADLNGLRVGDRVRVQDNQLQRW